MSVTARQELRTQLKLALPIFGGQLAQSANGFVDTVMAGRVSALDLAAVAVGASIWVPVFLFMTGMLMSATSVLARHVGANNWPVVSVGTLQYRALAAVDGCRPRDTPHGGRLLIWLELGNASHRNSAWAAQLYRGHEPHSACLTHQCDWFIGQYSHQLRADLRQIRNSRHGRCWLRLGHGHRDVDYGDIDGDICASASGLSQCAVNIPSLALGA